MKKLLTQCLLTLADTHVGHGGLEKYSDAEKLRQLTNDVKPEVLISQLAGLLLEKGVRLPAERDICNDPPHVGYVLGSRNGGVTFGTAPAEAAGYSGPAPANEYRIMAVTRSQVLDLMAYAGIEPQKAN